MEEEFAAVDANLNAIKDVATRLTAAHESLLNLNDEVVVITDTLRKVRTRTPQCICPLSPCSPLLFMTRFHLPQRLPCTLSLALPCQFSQGLDMTEGMQHTS